MNDSTYLVTHAQIQQLADYLVQRPWIEANPLIQMLQTLAREQKHVVPPTSVEQLKSEE